MPANASLLFTQQADKAVVAKGPTGNLTLRLQGIKKLTTWFTDRPERLAGVMPTADFADGFADAFGTVPPNAALVGTVDGRQVSVVLELDDPALEGDDLVYAVKATETETPAFDALVAAAESLGVEEVVVEDAALLIDSLICFYGTAPPCI